MHRSSRRLVPALVMGLAGLVAAARALPEKLFQSVLPLVVLSVDGKDHQLVGNALVLDREGYCVTLAHLVTALPAATFVPASRLGVLLPPATGKASAATAATRVFARVKVRKLDEATDLALVQVEGKLLGAAPFDAGEALDLDDPVKVFGFGKPGLAPHVFRGAVAAVLPLSLGGSAVTRFALDTAATAAGDGGAVVDAGKGEVRALAVSHLRNVHRVIVKLGDYEYGPAGTAVGIPIGEVLGWAKKAKAE